MLRLALFPTVVVIVLLFILGTALALAFRQPPVDPLLQYAQWLPGQRYTGDGTWACYPEWNMERQSYCSGYVRGLASVSIAGGCIRHTFLQLPFSDLPALLATHGRPRLFKRSHAGTVYDYGKLLVIVYGRRPTARRALVYVSITSDESSTILPC